MEITRSSHKIIYGLMAMFLLAGLFGLTVHPAHAATSPSIAVKAVNWDRTVTITGYGFPKNTEFIVRMDVYGNAALGGIAVDTYNSGDGTFEATFNLPHSLRGVEKIAIRMDSSSGYYAYTWFFNRTTTAYKEYPEVSIVDVKSDESVTVKTFKFPENIKFKVRMGEYGTAGINGILVDHIDSGKGGSFESTFTIPPSLKGSYQIAIRFESVEGYFAYNYFFNRTTTDYRGKPEFSIQSVVSNSTVTIKAYDFPVDQAIVVRMAAYGTKGENGVVVAETNSGEEGTFTATYNIPPALFNHEKIAIRMDSEDGYYAYNWFYNNTTE